MGGNYIKVDRKILKWEWWSDINTFRLFMYMLLSAWWKNGSYKGVEIPRGSFPSSNSELSKETGLTDNEIRTALKHLKSSGEITSKSNNKFTVFTINNYDLYQPINEQDYSQTTVNDTGKAQTINKPLTSHNIKECNNINNINNKRINKESNTNVLPKKSQSNFVPPTVEEVEAYCTERGNGIDAQSFVDFYESKGWMVGKNKMKVWKAAVRTWENEKKKKMSQQQQTAQTKKIDWDNV